MPPSSPLSPHTPGPIILPTLSRMPSVSSTGTTPMLPVPPPMASTRLNAPRVPMPRLVSDPTRPPPPYQRVDTPDPFDDSVPAPAHASAPLHAPSTLQDVSVSYNQEQEREQDRGPDIDRHPDFWFIDGTAILLCGRTGFRVHAGVLRMHCAAFRELLPVRLPIRAPTSSPLSAASSNSSGSFRTGHTPRTPSKAEMLMNALSVATNREREREEQPQDEEIEGCPVLRLADAPDDFVLFLRALYDRSFLQNKHTSSLFAIGAVLALARAYGAHALLSELSRYLRSIYPSSLGVYTMLYCPFSISHSCSLGWEHEVTFNGASPLPRDAHPLLALEIAARARLPAITPVALLRAARVPLSEVFDGFSLQDGRRVRVGQDTVRRVIEFREKLNALVEDALRQRPLEPHTCNPDYQRDACEGINAERVRALEAAIRERGLEAGITKSVRKEGVLCFHCINVVEEWEEGVRGKIWRGVPVVAGEPGSWDAIERAADD
ncbi:hypothetical protein PENSPDRAFT_691717 [Peniophora sp. CONT]|nr:hypothetical protein PENSPDRAFT_691717 [Peniophora sp. CONT]